MANLCKSRVTVEYDGASFIIWQGNVQMLVTRSPADLVAACRGRIPTPPVPKTKPTPVFETVEDALARGVTIKRPKLTPAGWEFTPEEVALAVSQLTGEKL